MYNTSTAKNDGNASLRVGPGGLMVLWGHFTSWTDLRNPKGEDEKQA